MKRNQFLKILMPTNSPSGAKAGPDYRNIFINAGIMGGISLFSCLVSLVPVPNSLAAAGLAFFTSAAIQLGLIEKK